MMVILGINFDGGSKDFDFEVHDENYFIMIIFWHE